MTSHSPPTYAQRWSEVDVESYMDQQLGKTQVRDRERTSFDSSIEGSNQRRTELTSITLQSPSHSKQLLIMPQISLANGKCPNPAPSIPSDCSHPEPLPAITSLFTVRSHLRSKRGKAFFFLFSFFFQFWGSMFLTVSAFLN